MASLPLILSLSDGCFNDYGHGYYPRRNQHHYHQTNLDHHYTPHHGSQHTHHHSHHPGFGLVGPSCCVTHKEKCDDKECTPHAYPSAPVVGKDGFQVSLDVQLFQPNELTVKMVDNCIVIEGKHEEREDDHGHITRHFVRRYVLPEGYDLHDAVSTLSSDGIITVKVPPPRKGDSDERLVQIHHTGPAHLSVNGK